MLRDGQEKGLLILLENCCIGYDFEKKKWYKQMELPTKDKDPGKIFYNSEGLFYMSGTYQSDVEDEDEEGTDMIIWKFDSEFRVWKEIQNSKIDSGNRAIEFTLSGSKIVAIFGEYFQEERVPTDKVSVFDLNNSDLGWRQIASLNRAGTNFKLVTHEGVVYSFSPEIRLA